MQGTFLIRSIVLAAAVGLSAWVALSQIIPKLGLLNSGKSNREIGYDTDRPATSDREGSEATSPDKIPPGGWIDIVKRTYHEIGRDRVMAVAAGVAFYGLLAVVPALTAFVSLYGILADPSTIIEHLAAVESFLPGDAVGLVRDQLIRITSGDETKLGLALLIGLALSIWSANAGVKAIFDALNVAYGEQEKRGFLRLNLTSLAFTTGIIVFLVIALGAVAAIPALLARAPLNPSTEWLIWIGRWPVLALVVMLGLAVLYRFGPSRDEPKWSWVSPGAAFASAAWLMASALFSWYVANFEDYNKTYGTLGAVVGLLMWMWLSATIVLIGAELNSEAERQTLRDTTKGAPMPIGMRGADAADRKD